MDESRVAPPREDGQDQVVHQYDDIQEYDNKLPNWWLFTLYATMVFAVLYWFHYEGFKSGMNPRAAYDAEEAAVNAAIAQKAKTLGTATDETLAQLAKDPATLAQGKEVFGSTCVACHGPNAGGGIGPNLTDDAWLHGGKPANVYKSIRDGWTDKGMAAWGPQLGEERVRAVAAYVVSLRNTNVAGGKVAQGERGID